MNRPELILFAKQPLAGRVKTRLQPRYTPEQAATIAGVMIRVTVAQAAVSWPGEISLYVQPDPRHALFQALAREYGIRLAVQGGGDLGEKMLAAQSEGIDRHGAAAVMGCDVPHCPPDIFVQAATLLAQGENAIGPTEDGGYYLIGLHERQPDLFHRIKWGGKDVLKTTLARAEVLGLAFTLLPTLTDIDTWDDLQRVAPDFPPLREFL